ncbi:putative beta-lysine N-acetyltransferase [Heliorestis convoluta]|uniref:Putative beta-lysine N-acetyltransferase n=1 Tax=Heliorestis convoluta TaxID=356322 RepID=A0A5Q2N904_9FIRM|nr:putative beta-lysine N-acetyltransferase [Heliorestis convoluta]QGG48975.1 putative beta-lysine N-acetyltransferase [Heliorestis convoluta]
MTEKKIEGSSFRATVTIDSRNSRLKVQSFEGPGYQEMIDTCKSLAEEEKLGKIIWYLSTEAAPAGTEILQQAGFIQEGKIPGFFKGQDALCNAYFVDPDRAQSAYFEEEQKILDQVRADKVPGKTEAPLPANLTIRTLEEEDAKSLVSLYKAIFESYPSPLFDITYIKQIMRTHVYFMGVFEKGHLIAAGSAEMDLTNRNAEMTDLATRPEARGQGLGTSILQALEEKMIARQIPCLYSLVRAGVPSANRGLYKLGYHYQGKHINNCHIDGNYENMNIWSKKL